MGLSSEIPDDILEEASHFLEQWRQVVIFYSLRLSVSPVVESLILLDRQLYLYEQGLFKYKYMCIHCDCIQGKYLVYLFHATYLLFYMNYMHFVFLKIFFFIALYIRVLLMKLFMIWIFNFLWGLIHKRKINLKI